MAFNCVNTIPVMASGHVHLYTCIYMYMYVVDCPCVMCVRGFIHEMVVTLKVIITMHTETSLGFESRVEFFALQ